MSKWKEYRKKGTTEMRPVTDDDVIFYNTFGYLAVKFVIFLINV